MITTIIFDAFGTLFKVAEGGSAKKIIYNIVACDKEVNYESFVEEWKHFYKRYTVSESLFRTERDIFISRIKMFYDRFGVKRSAIEDTDALLAEALERKAYEEAKEVLDKLREKYNVFIGSNTDNDVLESVMSGNGILADKIYTSENLKCYKPNILFFKRILEDNGLKPKEVLFVGDSVSDDILGPKALGIKTVLVNRSEKTGDFGQDYTIENLRMLYEILDEENEDMVELREITKENIDDVLKLRIAKHQETFVSTTAESLAQAYVYKENAFPFAIYFGELLVGFVMLGYYEAKNQYTLWKLLIDEKYQNNGYGKCAVKLAIKYLIDKFNVGEVYVGVAFGNDIARDLYYSMGFRETGEKDKFQYEMRWERRNEYFDGIIL